MLIGILAFMAVGVATYLAMRLLTTERQRVERVVRGLARRIERRDPGGLCQLLAEDYRDSHGFDRLAVRSLVTQAVGYLTRISIRIEDLQVTVNGEAATAEFAASATAEAPERTQQPPWRHQTRVRLELRKAEGEWRVRRAEYALPPIVEREGL